MRIETRLSERLRNIKPSSTLAITTKAKKLKSEGKDIINLAAGEPDFDTPEFIKEAAIAAIKTGFTKYTPSSGTLELKQAISKKFKEDNGLDYPPQQIVVSSGAKHSIFNTLLAIINPKDEVLIPSPYWVSYPEMVRICGGVPKFIETKVENDFKITPEELSRCIGPRTKLLIINSPSNPCGSVYTKAELESIAHICVKKKIFVISDEIYEKIIFDGLRHVSIASLGKDIYDLTVTVNGVSKTYSMTGWRIGYLGGPSDIVEAISKIQDHSTSNPTSISQKAAEAALNTPQDFINMMCNEFQKRREYTIQRLKGIKKITYVKPHGAFYIFCNISQTGLDSLTFAERLLQEALVALIPGEGFGRNDYVRLSFATSLQQLEKAFNRIETWLRDGSF